MRIKHATTLSFAILSYDGVIIPECIGRHVTKFDHTHNWDHTLIDDQNVCPENEPEAVASLRNRNRLSDTLIRLSMDVGHPKRNPRHKTYYLDPK